MIYYQPSKYSPPVENGEILWNELPDMVLTLRAMGDGTYQVVSNQRGSTGS